MIKDKVQIRNFKCFNEEGSGFDCFKLINIIIGKNNSGKSSLLELVKYLCNDETYIFLNKRNNKTPEISIEHIITKGEIERNFHSTSSANQSSTIHQYGLEFENEVISVKILENNNRTLVSLSKTYVASSSEYFNSLINDIALPFKGKIFCHLSAERDILIETQSQKLVLTANGTGATNYIQEIINRNQYESSIIENRLLFELNKILNPDISFKRLLVQQNNDGIWEIYFDDEFNARIPLSKMGSGLKTILLVLLNIFVRPIIENRKPNDYVFALEELENNLHPSLQRRLYYYLLEFAREKQVYLFITTHSNIVIDLFSAVEFSQILHIINKNGNSTVVPIIDNKYLNLILDDLDIKASDILQSNCIIWVEGPSDRNYLRKWISLIDDSLLEGYHYSIMFYGGKLLSNLSLDHSKLRDELIPLLKVNRNAFVVIDRDGKTINSNLNRTKKRILNEIDEGCVWITKGREIENYLSDKSIRCWLKGKHNIITSLNNNANEKLEDNIQSEKKARKIKYNLNKTLFSHEITDYISYEDLKVHDLENRIIQMVKKIKQWNK